jgi:hypothetical protein
MLYAIFFYHLLAIISLCSSTPDMPSWDLLTWHVCRGFTQSLKAYSVITLLGNDRFLPYPFQFIIHPIIRRYTVWTADSIVKWNTHITPGMSN